MEKSASSPRHYENILISIATGAISRVAGVVPMDSKKRNIIGRFRNRGGVQVTIDGKRVTFDVSVCIRNEHRVPDIVFAIQEGIKKEVEAATAFKIRAINVNVVGVIFAS